MKNGQFFTVFIVFPVVVDYPQPAGDEQTALAKNSKPGLCLSSTEEYATGRLVKRQTDRRLIRGSCLAALRPDKSSILGIFFGLVRVRMHRQSRVVPRRLNQLDHILEQDDLPTGQLNLDSAWFKTECFAHARSMVAERPNLWRRWQSISTFSRGPDATADRPSLCTCSINLVALSLG